MPRIQPLELKQAPEPAAQILSDVQQKLNRVPNIIATMAHSPAVAQAYLAFSGALADGELSSSLREQIALTVAEANSCHYCLAAHAALGKLAGLSAEQVLHARQGQAADTQAAAALGAARKLVEQRGQLEDQDLEGLRQAGFSDGGIAEIVANVALNLFTNYFNHVSDPEIDFPAVAQLDSVA